LKNKFIFFLFGLLSLTTKKEREDKKKGSFVCFVRAVFVMFNG